MNLNDLNITQKLLFITLPALLFAFYFLYLFIMNIKRKSALDKHLNVKKVTVSESGIPMIWISEDDFFVDIEVDRSQSYRETLKKSGLSYHEDEKNLFNDLPRSDEKKVRLYFIKIENTESFPKMDKAYKYLSKNKLKPDPFAYLALFQKNIKFEDGFNDLSISCIWKSKYFPGVYNTYMELVVASNKACICLKRATESTKETFESHYVCGVKK